jgi:outer membrane protein assembly factor BamB
VIALTVGVAACGFGATASAHLGQVSSTGGWTQFQGGPDHAGYVRDGPAPPFSEAWRFAEPLGGATSSTGVSAPVVAGADVVVVGPEAVIEIGVGDGIERWRLPRDPGPPVPAGVGDVAGRPVAVYTEGFGPNPPGGTPTGTSTSGANGSGGASTPSSPSGAGAASPTAGPGVPAAGGDAHLVAVDLRGDRSERWRVSLPSGSRTGVTIEGDGAYVGSNDGTVSAMDLSTGDLRWTARAGGFLQSPLAVSEGLVLVGITGGQDTTYSLAAFRVADGTEAWRYAPETAAQVAGVVAIADGVAYVGLADRTLRAISVVDGSERWTAQLNAPVGPQGAPAVTGDAVIAVDVLGQIYRFDVATGERVWDQALNTTVLRSSPVVSGQHVLVPSGEGELFAVEILSGDLVWQGSSGSGLLRTLAVTPDRVIAVSGGLSPGLVAWTHDPAGSLIRIVTPTRLDPGRLVLGFLIGAVPVVVVLWLGGWLLAARLGSPFVRAASEEDGSDDDGAGTPPDDDHDDDEGRG